MAGCELCPRRCGALREEGQRGFCGADNRVLVARIAPHAWEEPCLSGTRGSGTVFFSGCPLGCVFCQNRAIRSGGVGRAYTVPELAEAFRSLEAQGVHNLNLVTPTQFTPQIVAALDLARPGIPVVYNCGGYERTETLDTLRGRVSVFLPDFKYARAETADRLAHAPDYPEVALAAIGRMIELVGRPVTDGEGMLTRGVLVRHLVLPGYADDSMKALRMLRSAFGDDIWISVMNQYTPMPGMRPPLDRSVSEDEYTLVLDYADHLGITEGFRQEGGTVSESFIPPFEDA